MLVSGDLTRGFRDGVGGDCIEQSNLKGSRSGDFFRRYKKLERSSLPDQAGETLRSSPTCDQAQSGAAMAEDRAGGGDSAMTGEGQVESSTHAMAFDGGGYRGGLAGNCVHQLLSQG